MNVPFGSLIRRLAAVPMMMSWAAVAAAQSPPPAAPVAPVVPIADDASSYSIGLTFGRQLYNNGVDQALTMDAFLRGLKAGLAGKVITPQDQTSGMQLLRQGRDALALRNHATARDFLAKNGTLEGITTTTSGLQYRVIAPGNADAASPGPNDRVTVHYVGRLIDGTEFDNSEAHGGQPATINLNGVIAGWREALLLMKPGAKWRLYIPPALGFDSTSTPAVPPGSLLIADIELVKFDAAPR